MATILITWELGAGTGHVSPYIHTINCLELSGHTIYFAARSQEMALQLLEQTGTTVLQAPVLSPPADQLINVINSFPTLLNNNGYAKSDQINDLLVSWENIFNKIKPDVVLFDYSPTALLAARKFSFGKINIGASFYTPPDFIPCPDYISLQGGKADNNALIRFERDVILNINAALVVYGAPPIKRLHDIHQCHIQLFTSFAELESYPVRQQANFIGPCLSKGGSKPDWPEGTQLKIFAYLNVAEAAVNILKHLSTTPYSILVYAPNSTDELKDTLSSTHLVFMDEPADMEYIGQTANLGICHGNHGTTTELLLHGIPVYALPIQAEQHINGRNLEKYGLGKVCPENDVNKISAGLDQLTSNNNYSDNAKAFSQKYQHLNRNSITDTIIDTINRVIELT